MPPTWWAASPVLEITTLFGLQARIFFGQSIVIPAPSHGAFTANIKIAIQIAVLMLKLPI